LFKQANVSTQGVTPQRSNVSPPNPLLQEANTEEDMKLDYASLMRRNTSLMEFCKFCHQRGLKPGGNRCIYCKKWRDGKQRAKYNKKKDQPEDDNDGEAVLNVPTLPCLRQKAMLAHLALAFLQTITWPGSTAVAIPAWRALLLLLRIVRS
jgi:hypothetical protein